MNAAISDIDALEYSAIHERTAVFAYSDALPLRIEGADRSDFLHRITTNDINALLPGQSVVTILTTPTARIQFVFTVLCLDDELLVLPAQGQSEALAKHLRGQVFFMDQVKIDYHDLARWRVVGPEATQSLNSLGLLPQNATDATWWKAEGAIFAQQSSYGIPGYEVVGQLGSDQGALANLVAGAADLARSPAYEVCRIEMGRPAPGHELTESYNPLEVGMARVCSETKGCYTGQEIIARQITYDKVTKSLVGLRSEEPVACGDRILADGKAVGTVTSAAYSPALDEHIALAVVQRPHNSTGVEVTVRPDGGEPISATIVEVPFL